jgi:hypothetical protein
MAIRGPSSSLGDESPYSPDERTWLPRSGTRFRGSRLERLVDAGLPPGIRLALTGGLSLGQQSCDSLGNLRGLRGDELELHGRERITRCKGAPSFEGSHGRVDRLSPIRVMPRSGAVTHDAPKRHQLRRSTSMLQWNSKFVTLVVFGLLVVLATIGGHFGFHALNFTW